MVCGSRSWRDHEAIREYLRKLPRGAIIRHGGAGGADRMAGTVAASLGFAVDEMPAFWRVNGVYNPSAGFERNISMLDKEPRASRVAAFWDGRSTGTKHTITEALRRALHVEITYPRRTFP